VALAMQYNLSTCERCRLNRDAEFALSQEPNLVPIAVGGGVDVTL